MGGPDGAPAADLDLGQGGLRVEQGPDGVGRHLVVGRDGVGQAVPAPAQPVEITPRKPAPAGRRSTVVSANNGVDGSER